MFLKVHWIVTLIGLAAGMAIACSATEPQFTGFISRIERGPGMGEARIVVESHAHKIVQRHVLIVTPRTVIIKRENNVEKTVNLDSLMEKDWVKVWFAGRRKSSYPIEVSPERIVIVDRL